jgi:membrane fusion protein (multidrug efflux system)
MYSAIQQRRRNRFSLLITAFHVPAICGLLLSCNHSSRKNSPTIPVSVTVVRLHSTDVAIRNEWVGTLDGFVNAQIQPQVSGYLIRQFYREGETIREGQTLFEIDPRPYRAALEQAQGQLGQAQGHLAQVQSQVDLARINVARDTPLVTQNAVSQSQLDNEEQQAAQAQAALVSAQAAVATAKASVDAAKLNVEFTRVRSLVTGVAGQTIVQVGNLVSPQTVLTSVSQINPIKAFFSLSDAEYLRLKRHLGTRGNDLLRDLGNVPLTLTLTDGTTFSHTGHIVFVDRQMNQQTGAIRVAASFPNPGNVLRPGQFGRVQAVVEIRHDALKVPQSTVIELQGATQVYTVSADNKAHIVNVTLGPQSGANWIVESGLRSGDRIITDNLQQLREGVAVDSHDQPSTANAAQVFPGEGK